MPPWGRPPGGRQGRKNKRGWGGQQSWNERRFEEIEDSEDDDEQDVELDLGVSQKRYASDELRFTGVDLSSSRARRRKGIAYDEDSEYSEDEDDGYGGQAHQMQVVLREKEDFLVERALERIRRARMLGKTNVKLSQAEVDALERAERIQKEPDPPRILKGKKAATTRPRVEERKRSKSDKPSSNTPPLKAIEPRRKAKSSARDQPQPPQPPYPMLPSPDYGQSSGAMVYTPPGYYSANAQRPRSSSSRTGSRTASSQSLRQPQQHTPPLPQYQHPYHAGRYFSNPDTAYAGRPPSNSSLRSDPSDPHWEPRARSASNLVPHLVDQPPYPLYQPAPPQFDPRDPRFAVPPGPRIAPGPSDMYPVPQVPGYRHPQDEMFLYSPQSPGESNTTGDDDDEDDDDDDDDDDQGVEIDVVEGSAGTYGIQTRSSAAAAAGNRGRGGGVVAKRAKRGK
jgi:PRA1 family protein 1